MQDKKKKKNAIYKYVTDNGVMKAFFAKKCEITPSTLSCYMRGKDMFLSTAKRITEASNGLITLEDIAKGIEK